jgi:hypothetical protein
VDKSALQSTISVATILLNAVELSDTDGSALPDGMEYVPTLAWEAFEGAINSAQAVIDDEKVIQSRVNEETEGLKAAISIFEGEINTVGGAANNKPQLGYAIQAAEQLFDSVIKSADPNLLASGTRYVTTGEGNTFNTAITTAKTTYNKEDATPTQVRTAVGILNIAKAAFASQIKTTIAASSFRDQLIRKPALDISVRWQDYWGTGFQVGGYPNGGSKEAAILALPFDYYFRVVFENIGSDWPETVSAYGSAYTFSVDFLKFVARDGNGVIPRMGVKLEGHGPVAGGCGEVFMPVYQFQEYLTQYPKWDGYQICYGRFAVVAGNDPHPKGHGFPTMVLGDGDTLVLEMWEPVVRKVNKSGLNAALAAAQTLLDSVTPSNDWTILPDKAKYAATSACNTFEGIIADAQELMDDDNAIQADVNTAISALNGAIALFEAAVNTVDVDRAVLQANVALAKIMLAAVDGTSDDGTGITSGDYVSQTARDDFAVAINASDAVFKKAAASQSEVDAAVSVLDSARTTFEGEIHTVALDATELESLIGDSETLLGDVTRVNYGSGLSKGDKYARESDYDDFEDAIGAAQDLCNNFSTSQTQVNIAVVLLSAAKTVFEGKIRISTGPMPAAIHHWELKTDGNDLAGGTPFTLESGWHSFGMDPGLGHSVMTMPYNANNKTVCIVDYGYVTTLADMTASMWINPENFGAAGQAHQNLIQFVTGYDEWGMALPGLMSLGYRNKDDGTGVLAVSNGWGDNLGITINNSDYNGKWTHVALTIKGDKAILYINGVKVSERTGTVYILNWDAPTTGTNQTITGPAYRAISLGGSYGNQRFGGKVTDLRLYDEELSAGQIEELAGI